ncbi:unnamed protein product [Rotaria sp. Silwood2]|nr:unnamed protein product [Rotaria sp. Silwood2]CAF2958427.1 unnamed protein product [Rotaria sp. Silwood2]CAF3324807.1 unnamed protein product [Rotaria sp. Silwood2]CAF4218968.1 unnamed protein product [Rotaria sp. Silwood2]CAF4517036.1 unnamed protein product [Rotaria sp. Silwood2]
MFYPTCYVYKIGSNDESTTNNENTSTNKKSNTSITKKPKSTATTTTSINTTLDITSNKNIIENSFIKKFANNLLVATQRNNCIDLEKKQDNQQNDICLTINDPVNHHLCQSNQTLSINARSSPFIPFHRRPQSIENHDTLIESTSSSRVTTNTQLTTNEKPADWTASTPNSVGGITAPNPISTRGIKRSATKAFDETFIEDDEPEQQKQTYHFYRSDSFLQLPLKRFRTDDQLNLNEFESTITTCEHVYQHGQPTPPSPSQISFHVR